MGLGAWGTLVIMQEVITKAITKSVGFTPPPALPSPAGLARPPAPRVSNETQSLHESQQGIMIKLKIAGDLNFELTQP